MSSPMRGNRPVLLLCSCLLALSARAEAPPATAVSAPSPFTPPRASEPNFCSGEYADDLSALSPRAREFERQPQGQYTYCVRNTATYECVSYAPDGTLRRTRRKAVAHGTAFAYRRLNGETYFLTNQHVAEWPAVTDDDHPAGDVPAGCKRVSDTLKIVDNEGDAYERDDVPLTHIVSDPALDMAVLKAHAELPVLPWKIGRSSALHERNVVDVRGFPLGAFKATNVGKVISAYDHDDFKDWDHDDFVVDALLSPGNSGSPVLAVSCKTGEFELVGVYHAGYTGGSALNVVVGIDQIRDLMTTLKRTSHPRADGAVALDGKARDTLLQNLPPFVEPFFPFGSLAAVVRARDDGALVFEVLNRDFPLKAYPVLVLEDLPSRDPTEFGTLGRIWFGNRQGLKAYRRTELDGDAQVQVGRMLDALRHDALTAFDYRSAARDVTRSREQFDHVAHLERVLRKAVASRQDMSQTASDLADRFSPHPAESGLEVAAVFKTTPAAPPAAVPGAAPPTAPGSPPGPGTAQHPVIPASAHPPPPPSSASPGTALPPAKPLLPLAAGGTASR